MDAFFLLRFPFPSFVLLLLLRVLSISESLLKRIQNEPLPESLPLDLSDGYEADLSLFSRDLLFLNVGFGFFCQMTRDEARAFLPGKLELLRRLLKRRDAKIQTINRHLATTERVIRELKSLSSSTMNK